jgi:hypothetical protein
MLASSGQVAYISEPLNVFHRPGVMRAPVQHWYTYICADNEDRYLDALSEMLAFNYHLGREIRSLRNPKDGLRLARDGGAFLGGRWYRQRPLIKDPFAIFSSQWFAERLGCQVLIMIRHPGAFVSSVMRLGWDFDFADLLSQPLLLRDWLAGYENEISKLVQGSKNILIQGCLLWSIIYKVVYEMKERNPGFITLRHEDLSQDPQARFLALFEKLGLDYSAKAARVIQKYSGRDNPVEVSRQNVHSVRVDSRTNLENWKRRLAQEEIAKVRELTAEVYPLFYEEGDWD